MAELKNELLKYAKLKERVKQDYIKFNALDQAEKLNKIHDPKLFFECPVDESGIVKLIFFPDYIYDWMECEASIEFLDYCRKNNDPVYENFIKVYKLKRGK